MASRISDSSTGGYWGEYGVLAGAGLLLALSQLVGGWTKWGRPTISLAVFPIALLPALACVGWTVLAHGAGRGSPRRPGTLFPPASPFRSGTGPTGRAPSTARRVDACESPRVSDPYGPAPADT